METNTARPLVIYHSPCFDGFTAAWAVWLHYPNAEFVPGVYGQAPPECSGRDVILVASDDGVTTLTPRGL